DDLLVEARNLVDAVVVVEADLLLAAAVGQVEVDVVLGEFADVRRGELDLVAFLHAGEDNASAQSFLFAARYMMTAGLMKLGGLMNPIVRNILAVVAGLVAGS